MAFDGKKIGAKFARFTILQTSYKTVAAHDIRADFIIPKSVDVRKKSPVIVRFHGGGLSTGDSLYEPWFPKWLLELAESSSAIIASANYRFLPEVTGADVLDDVDDFWSWLHSREAASFLGSSVSGLQLDLDRVITAGDSAGGLLSVYLAISHAGDIRSATAAYPSLHWDDPPIWAVPTPDADTAASVIAAHLENLGGHGVQSSDPSLARAPLSTAITQGHRGPDFYFRGASESARRGRLSQLGRLDEPDVRLPRGGLVILHGKDDVVVKVGASERFVDKARRTLQGRQGGDRIVLQLRPGDHGFEVDASIEEEWLRSALEFAVETWLN
ncbi:uncharacterized protein BJX67DRAFT_383763 [Aspergillus lucknowensis]|uniref:Alpha/Beta hydrolase protein n=1 Tax=Aspergillus lucknowensis TaxID=176173 RepID=A0ABR4LJ31_9EURO